jgi:hypothetical protein
MYIHNYVSSNARLLGDHVAGLTVQEFGAAFCHLKALENKKKDR